MFLFLDIILQRQMDQFDVSLSIVHLIKVVRYVHVYILAVGVYYDTILNLLPGLPAFQKQEGLGTSLVHIVS